jgi:hypothetical protein
VNHFQVARWATAEIHWDGTKEELDYFQKWVEKYVPEKYRHWYNRIGEPGEEFHDTHLSGYFDCVAWTFMCYHWTNVHAPALNQIWKEKKNQYGNKPQFEGDSTLLEHDNAILCLTWAHLQKEARDEKTPEVKACIAFLHKNWEKVRKRLNKEKEKREKMA